MKYKIVSAKTIPDLEDKINEYVQKGWTISLLDEITFHDGMFHKQIVKNPGKQILKG